VEKVEQVFDAALAAAKAGRNGHKPARATKPKTGPGRKK
jgi:hypothetical protein